MLASLYYKKSYENYESLAKENYENSQEVFDKLPKLILNFDQILIPQFETIDNISEDDEEYVPRYILSVEEDNNYVYKEKSTEMIVDGALEFNIENITK